MADDADDISKCYLVIKPPPICIQISVKFVGEGSIENSSAFV